MQNWSVVKRSGTGVQLDIREFFPLRLASTNAVDTQVRRGEAYLDYPGLPPLRVAVTAGASSYLENMMFYPIRTSIYPLYSDATVTQNTTQGDVSCFRHTVPNHASTNNTVEVRTTMVDLPSQSRERRG